MKNSALRFLILTGLVKVALCELYGMVSYHSEEMTWAQTREYCRSLNADLDDGWYKQNCETDAFAVFCFQSLLVLVKENKTWEEAMDHCRDMNADLVSLSSDSAVLKTLYASKDAQTDHVWTGLRYLCDKWLWVHGQEMEFQVWKQGKMPTCPAITHCCGASSLEGWHWESWDCTDKLNFVCHYTP